MKKLNNDELTGMPAISDWQETDLSSGTPAEGTESTVSPHGRMADWKREYEEHAYDARRDRELRQAQQEGNLYAGLARAERYLNAGSAVDTVEGVRILDEVYECLSGNGELPGADFYIRLSKLYADRAEETEDEAEQERLAERALLCCENLYELDRTQREPLLDFYRSETVKRVPRYKNSPHILENDRIEMEREEAENGGIAERLNYARTCHNNKHYIEANDFLLAAQEASDAAEHKDLLAELWLLRAAWGMETVSTEKLKEYGLTAVDMVRVADRNNLPVQSEWMESFAEEGSPCACWAMGNQCEKEEALMWFKRGAAMTPTGNPDEDAYIESCQTGIKKAAWQHRQKEAKEADLQPEESQSKREPEKETEVLPENGSKKKNYICFALIVIIMVLLVGWGIAGSIGKKTTDADLTAQTNLTISNNASSSEASQADSQAAEYETYSTADDAQEPAAESNSLVQQESAVATDDQLVLRNGRQNAIVTVNGQSVPFSYVNNDIVISRSVLPDIKQVRVIAPTSDGWETAAVWYNSAYGNDLTLGDDNSYGAYIECEQDGLSCPSDQIVNVLTWAYYRSFLSAINEQSLDLMEYSTATNTQNQMEAVYEINKDCVYDLTDFTAVCDPSSILYEDKRVVYNGSFRSIYTGKQSGQTEEITSHRTIELLWEDGYWKVNRVARLSDEDFVAGKYADLS